jgi:Double zinc ribbon
MRLCSQCHRIVTPESVCGEAACPMGLAAGAVEKSDAAPPAAPPAPISAPAPAPPSDPLPATSACGACGAAFSNDAAFCGECGTPTSEQTATAASDAALDPSPQTAAMEMTAPLSCTACGARMQVGDTFCGECGAKAGMPPQLSSPSAAMQAPEPIPERLASPAPMTEVATKPKVGLDPATIGAPNPALKTAPPADSRPEPEGDPLETAASAINDSADDSADDNTEETSRDDAPSKNLLYIGGVLIAALIGGGIWAMQSGGAPDASAETAAAAPALDPAIPRLLGKYKGHFADQDIVITIAGAMPKTLVESAGIARYANVVNGGTCAAAFVPMKGADVGGGVGAGVGGVVGNAVNFKQTPVPGEPECDADIPVRIDISGEEKGKGGLVTSMQVQWLDPKSGKVLMQGPLKQEP